jgi:hypothetical protein
MPFKWGTSNPRRAHFCMACMQPEWVNGSEDSLGMNNACTILMVYLLVNSIRYKPYQQERGLGALGRLIERKLEATERHLNMRGLISASIRTDLLVRAGAGRGSGTK